MATFNKLFECLLYVRHYACYCLTSLDKKEEQSLRLLIWVIMQGKVFQSWEFRC